MSYLSYKTTEYDWLGYIPSTWRWLYLSQSCYEQSIKNIGNVESNVLSLSYGHIVPKKNIDFGLSPKDYGTYQIVDNGNIIMRLTDLQNDHKSLRSGLVKERGIITSAYVCLKPFENPDFLQYLLHSYDTQKFFYGLGGGVRQSIGYKDIRYIKVPLPPRDEQDQIVHYLDWKVSGINKLINAKKRQIGLLQEQKRVFINNTLTKNGEAWHNYRAKYLFTERNERSEHGHETHLSMSQKYGLVSDEQLDERRMLSESYEGGKICYENDVVLNRLKAHLGVFALAPQKGVISPDYTVLQPITAKIIPKYAEYYLKSDACRYELRIRVRGVVEGFWRLYTEDFNTISIPTPSLDEQTEILRSLDNENNRSEKLVGILNNEIVLLHEYRTRLISDVVTGKLDVRGVAVPEYEVVEVVADDVVDDDEVTDEMAGEE